jgi:hypothetical protein
MVTKGKGESQKTLKIRHFQAIDISSSLVYRSKAEVQKILDFRFFFAVAAFIPPVTGRGSGYRSNREPGIAFFRAPEGGRIKACRCS